MILLGLDASTPKGSVALLNDGRIIAESTGSSTFSDQILVLMDEVLGNLDRGLEEVDGFCVTTGPGSFTGLRVGVSLIKGLVLATEKPFWGINTLEAYANMVGPVAQPISPILDARKKEVYTALFNSENDQYLRKTPDQAISAADLCDQIKQPTAFVGNGLDVYRDVFTSRLKDKFVHNVPLKNLTVAASAVLIANVEENLHYDLDSLMINYVRPSEAELNYKASK